MPRIDGWEVGKWGLPEVPARYPTPWAPITPTMLGLNIGTPTVASGGFGALTYNTATGLYTASFDRSGSAEDGALEGTYFVGAQDMLFTGEAPWYFGADPTFPYLLRTRVREVVAPNQTFSTYLPQIKFGFVNAGVTQAQAHGLGWTGTTTRKAVRASETADAGGAGHASIRRSDALWLRGSNGAVEGLYVAGRGTADETLMTTVGGTAITVDGRAVLQMGCDVASAATGTPIEIGFALDYSISWIGNR